MTHADAMMFWLTKAEIELWLGIAGIIAFILIGGIVLLIGERRRKKRMKELDEKINMLLKMGK